MARKTLIPGALEFSSVARNSAGIVDSGSAKSGEHHDVADRGPEHHVAGADDHRTRREPLEVPRGERGARGLAGAEELHVEGRGSGRSCRARPRPASPNASHSVSDTNRLNSSGPAKNAVNPSRLGETNSRPSRVRWLGLAGAELVGDVALEGPPREVPLTSATASRASCSGWSGAARKVARPGSSPTATAREHTATATTDPAQPVGDRRTGPSRRPRRRATQASSATARNGTPRRTCAERVEADEHPVGCSSR
jgi:hypothetical protein